MKVSEKLGKIKCNCFNFVISDDCHRSVDWDRYNDAFGLQGAKFTEGAAETARISELATRQEAVSGLTIPQQILSFIPKNVLPI